VAIPDGKAVEILKGSHEALFEPPAVSADGRQLAVILRRDGEYLHVHLRWRRSQSLAEPIDIQDRSAGARCHWIIAVASTIRSGLFKIP
jgi:hypothetical protein